MIRFLGKIAQIPTIQNVSLLSHHGEILFYQENQSSSSADKGAAALLHTIITDLNSPETSILRFSEGCLYLHSTVIGYITIFMSDDSRLNRLKEICCIAEKKLAKKGIGREMLLYILQSSSDELKPHLIRALVPFAGKKVAKSLVGILANLKTSVEETREPIMLAACRTLGYCSYAKAIPNLQAILWAHDSGELVLDCHVREAIHLAIQQLECEQFKKESSPHLTEVQENNLTPAAPSPPQFIEHLAEKDEIENLLAKDKKPEALQLIFSLIQRAVTGQDFYRAEELKEWMQHIAPMAIAESVGATELIESGKAALIVPEFYQVWKGLTETLTTEELADLYHAMECRSYPYGEQIVQQGEVASELYFVQSGRAQVYSHMDGREVPVRIVEEGGILGHGSFFQFSIWTSGAKSQGAQIYVLSQKNMFFLDKKYPGLQQKLSRFCKKMKTASTLLQKLNRSRRRLEREPVSGPVAFVLLASNGRKTKYECKGRLRNISQNGICFTVHASRRQNAQKLFGREIRLMLKRNNSQPHIERSGKILAVRDHNVTHHTYSAHVQFNDLLSTTEMREIIVRSKFMTATASPMKKVSYKQA